MLFKKKNRSKYIDVDTDLTTSENTEGRIFICNLGDIRLLVLDRDNYGDYEFLSTNLSDYFPKDNYENLSILLIDLGNNELMEAFSKEIIYKEHHELLSIKGHDYKSFSDTYEERKKYPLFISDSLISHEYIPNDSEMVSSMKKSIEYKDEISKIIKEAKEKIRIQYDSQIQSPTEYEYVDALLENTIFDLKKEAKKYKNSLQKTEETEKKDLDE